MIRGLLGRRVLLTAPGPRAADHGVHDGPGAVRSARPRVGADPRRGDGGRAAEDRPDVVWQITAAFSVADERLGGGHGLTTVTAYLADTTAPNLRGRFRSEALRRAAFDAVAELAYPAG